MLDLFIMIGFCFFLAHLIEARSVGYESVREAAKIDWSVKILYFILILVLILFSGLRTTYNDTETYMQAFQYVDINNFTVAAIFESYGGFAFFQFVLKKYVSENPQVLILASSIFVNFIFVRFYAKYSKCFGLTIFSYLILGPYVFSMAGIKQIMAMSLSLFAIENLLKKHYFKFFIWILIAMTFHPYIICLAITPLFTENVWNKKMIVFLCVAVVGVANLDTLLNFAGMIGKEYSIEEMTSYTVNPMRVVVEIIPVIFSWVGRRKINSKNDKILYLGINMMIIAAFMISLGLLYNPIYFGRIGTYFSILNAIVIPMMLNVIYYRDVNREMYILAYYVFYCIYFILDLTKLGSISISYDLFHHMKIF